MVLHDQLKAHYLEQINQQLDKIPVESNEDLALLQEALQKIIDPNSNHTIAEKYQEKILHVNDFLLAPEDYVDCVDDYDEYREMIKNRIESKIVDIKLRREAAKNAYIQAQQAMRERAHEHVNQHIICQPLLSELSTAAHTLSGFAWLRDRTAPSQRVGHTQTTAENTRPIRRRMI